MSLKPRLDKSDEELKQLATGRFNVMRESIDITQPVLNAITQLADEIMIDVYNLKWVEDDPTNRIHLTGEQLLYKQNIVEALVGLVTKGKTK